MDIPYLRKPVKGEWTLVVLVFAGILMVIVLVTIIFFIPEYVRGYLDEKVQEIKNSESNTTLVPISPNCAKDMYNCSSFRTQITAQDVYEWCLSQGVGDVHNLGPDENGTVCGLLP